MIWQCPQCKIEIQLKRQPEKIVCACGYRGQFAVAPPRPPRPSIISLTAEERAARQERIAESVARDKRLISWLKFFRLPDEAGAGDTAHRLNKRSCCSPDAHALLDRLLKMCGCQLPDAIEKLNTQFPWGQQQTPE